MPWTVRPAVKLDQLRVLLGGRCVECGAEKGKDPKHPKLEFSHVQATPTRGKGRGSRARYYDIIRNPHCYVLRCYECHRRADHPSLLTPPNRSVYDRQHERDHEGLHPHHPQAEA